MKYEDIRLRYAYGYVTDVQLAEYVTNNVITQEQADAIKLDKTDPQLSAAMEQIKALLPKTPTTLAEYKQSKITESKTVLEVYLSSHPLTFNHNSVDQQYSVTQDKQSLLTSVLLMAKTALEAGISYEITWNATGQPCEVWTYEELLQLSLAINTYVKPLVTEQQYCEVAINKCTTIDEVNAIVIDYDAKPYSTNV